MTNNPRASDVLIQSQVFREHVAQAEKYAADHDLDPWAATIVWVCLGHGVLLARRFAMRRSNFRRSRAWACYQNLVQVGIFSEEPDGIIWEPVEPWLSDSMLWFDDLCRIATGAAVPTGFPRNES